MITQEEFTALGLWGHRFLYYHHRRDSLYQLSVEPWDPAYIVVMRYSNTRDAGVGTLGEFPTREQALHVATILSLARTP